MCRALLVIDMVNDFIDEKGSLFCGPAGRRILPFVIDRVRQAREAGDPVLFLTDRHLPDDPEFKMFPPHCVAGTKGAEAVSVELEPKERELVVPKRRFSSFFGTDLDLRLRELGADEIVIVGVCTNICVLYTAAEARMRGYEVTVPMDGVASFDEEAHRFALRQMETVLGVKIA